MHFVNQILLSHATLFSAASEEIPEGSIISVDSNLFLIWINVLILVAILALLLYKPVRKFMDKRSAGIAQNIEDAKETKKQAEILKLEYEEKLRDIEKERDQILMNANTKASQRSEEIIMEAREEAEQIHKHAMEEIEEERAAMQSDIKRQLIDLSLSIAERFVAVSIDQETQGKYVDQAIAEWEENRWQD